MFLTCIIVQKDYNHLEEILNFSQMILKLNLAHLNVTEFNIYAYAVLLCRLLMDIIHNFMKR